MREEAYGRPEGGPCLCQELLLSTGGTSLFFVLQVGQQDTSCTLRSTTQSGQLSSLRRSDGEIRIRQQLLCNQSSCLAVPMEVVGFLVCSTGRCCYCWCSSLFLSMHEDCICLVRHASVPAFTLGFHHGLRKISVHRCASYPVKPCRMSGSSGLACVEPGQVRHVLAAWVGGWQT